MKLVAHHHKNLFLHSVLYPFFALLILALLACHHKISDSTFSAVIISDTHVSSDESKDSRLRELIKELNSGKLAEVDILINTGDVVSCVYGSHRKDNPDTSENRLKKAIDIFSRLNIPYLLVMGNHDYKIGRDRDSDTYFPENEILKMEKIWKRFSGLEPYYAFTYKGWKFIVLNSMRGRYLHRHFDEQQMFWLQDQLRDELPTIVSFHHPIETDHVRFWCNPKDLITADKEPRFFEIIDKKKHLIKAIFVGHGHRFVYDTLWKTIPVYETDSFGDAADLIYYLVGFDNESHTIRVVKSEGVSY
jgi:3',5'-cyclic AMP phosphodiesterase CpdA